MAKVLTDKEMGGIIYSATHETDVIDCADAYTHFLEDLGDLITNHFGGERGTVEHDFHDGLGWTCGFHVNECVPSDGGVFKDYDTDVTWEDGEEKEGQALKKS